MSKTIIPDAAVLRPASLTLTEAEQKSLDAQSDFKETAEKFDRNAALDYFNRQVSRWSNRFTSQGLRRFAYVLGSAMDGEAHEMRIAVVSEAHRKGLKQTKPYFDLVTKYELAFHEPISERAAWRLLATLKRHGIVNRDRRTPG